MNDYAKTFCGKQRQCGGTNENPHMKQFLDNTAALRVMNSVALDAVRGNVTAQDGTIDVSDTPLPKRRRKH